LYDVGLSGKSFTGFNNYVEIFHDSAFLKSLRNTFYYVLVIVPTTIVLSFSLAGLMHGIRPRAKSWFRFLIYIPEVSTPVVLAMVWAWMYNTNFGLLNYLTAALGLGRYEWLGSPSTAFMAICIVVISWSIGQPVVLYLASMDGISRELYEAADIDGASVFRKFTHIMLPLISNTSLFVIISTTISVFQIFVVINLLTGGGPIYSTESLVFTIYRTAFKSVEYGKASAQSVILFLIIVAISIVQLRLFRSKND
jgi:ABC-type sugar transport system permease subunit